MAREIKLNSTEWCDMIFEGKNKNYGAYALRKTSSKRHVWALVVSLVTVAAMVAIPSLIKAVQPEKIITSSGMGPVVIGGVDEPEIPEEEEIIPPTTTPPPPPIVDSRMFTPPVITANELVDPDREMANQEELMKDTRLISIETHSEGNTTGMDIADIRREERNQIMDDIPTGPTVFDYVEVMPQFPGGEAELMRYLSSNIKYPPVMVETGVQGRVVLKFVVGKDGTVSDIQIERSLHPLGDKEAQRVVKAMPKWIPGQQNGNKVAVYYTLPVLFRLQ